MCRHRLTSSAIARNGCLFLMFFLVSLNVQFTIVYLILQHEKGALLFYFNFFTQNKSYISRHISAEGRIKCIDQISEASSAKSRYSLHIQLSRIQ